MSAPPLLPNYGESYRVSLKTKDPREAKIRFAAELDRSDELFENARRQLSGERIPTLQDAMQLAARWATAELTRMESTGKFTGYLVDLGNGEYETVSDLLDSPNPKARLQSKEMSLTDRTRLDLTIAEELAKGSLPIPLTSTTFHRYLQETFLAKHLELSEISYKRHQGNYSAGRALPQPHHLPSSSHDKMPHRTLYRRYLRNGADNTSR